MKLVYQAPVFFAVSSFEEKEIPKRAGFRWNPTAKRWETREAAVARRLQDYATDEAAQALDAMLLQHDTTVRASRAVTATVDVPCPDGLTYYGFQQAGIAFMAERPAVLLGDDMGLGKTIQVCGYLNLSADIHRVLVVCPASLRLNWQRELERWVVADRNLRVHLATTKQSLADLEIFWQGQGLRVGIINYDILHTFEEQEGYRDSKGRPRERFSFAYAGLDLVVADEAHFMKNEGARRSKAVRCITAPRKLLLTGTPLTNRPKELFPLLNYLAPHDWPNFFTYAKEFCAAHQVSIGRGKMAWDFSGASNLGRLQDRLRSTLMIRRLKKDVLPDLPAKQRQVIEIPANGAAKIVNAEQAAMARHTMELGALQCAVELAKAGDEYAYENAIARLRAGMQAAFTEMAQLRHATAVAKIPHVVAHVRAALEEDETTKIIIMAHHHDVFHALSAALAPYQPAILTGEIANIAARQAAVDRFQADPACRVFLGSITAAGMGITLTASSHVVFAELDWVPGNISQAEDRAHRIGQAEMVLIQHLVLEGSLDATMARRLVNKQAIIDAAMDTQGQADSAEWQAPLVPLAATDEPATASVSRRQVWKDAESLTQEEVACIQAQLQYLAACCDGARTQDGAGFNRLDTHIGKSLAACASLTAQQAVLGKRVLHKYARQLARAGAEAS